MTSKIPVSVVVATYQEADRLERCLRALGDFDEVVVVDSGSKDKTKDIAGRAGAKVFDFVWNGAYPKKRQWCLDHLPLRHEWVFFVDADEIVPSALAQEIGRRLSEGVDGYFVRGLNVVEGRVLRFGQKNNKLCLFRRGGFLFPVVDDLDMPGMGEMEGHYQPVPRNGKVRIGQMREALLHECEKGWTARHERYAAWETHMNRRRAWPRDPVRWRQAMKIVFRSLPGRPAWAFLQSYVLRLGFLDGKPGWHWACRRASYYAMIRRR